MVEELKGRSVRDGLLAVRVPPGHQIVLLRLIRQVRQLYRVAPLDIRMVFNELSPGRPIFEDLAVACAEVEVTAVNVPVQGVELQQLGYHHCANQVRRVPRVYASHEIAPTPRRRVNVPDERNLALATLSHLLQDLSYGVDLRL